VVCSKTTPTEPFRATPLSGVVRNGVQRADPHHTAPLGSSCGEQEIQAIADTACADLAGGKDSDTIVDAARTLGTVDAEATDHVTARELVKLAIDTTCLDQAPRVDEF
jgi:hypothetical protein